MQAVRESDSPSKVLETSPYPVPRLSVSLRSLQPLLRPKMEEAGEPFGSPSLGGKNAQFPLGAGGTWIHERRIRHRAELTAIGAGKGARRAGLWALFIFPPHRMHQLDHRHWLQNNGRNS